MLVSSELPFIREIDRDWNLSKYCTVQYDPTTIVQHHLRTVSTESDMDKLKARAEKGVHVCQLLQYSLQYGTVPHR